MYYDTCDMVILEILCLDEILWYYSAAMFWKIYFCIF